MPSRIPRGPYNIHHPIGFFFYELPKFFGFVEAIVFSPACYEIVPALFKRNQDGRIIYPLGTFKGTFLSEELKEAVNSGYLVYPLCFISFEKEKTFFNEFINETYNQRLAFPKNTPQNIFYKIIIL